MDRWVRRIAVVTGASSGLGADIAKELAIQGMIVVGLARRLEKLEDLTKQIPAQSKGKIYPIKCDVTDEKQLNKTFEWIDKKFGGVSVIVNNAGLIRACNFKGEGSTDAWREVMNTNVVGVCLCSRLALQSMLKHNIGDGQIINMNSIYGHKMAYSPVLDISIYFASKHAITVLTDALRKEIIEMKKNIRVASLSPGYTRTEIIDASGHKQYQDLKIFETWKVLEPEHITSGVIYILSAPPSVNVTELTIQAVGETA